MLTIAYLNNILLHAEFSAMYYTLNIVSKCRYFFISKHSRAPKRSWKIFHGVLESPGFFVSKRVGILILAKMSAVYRYKVADKILFETFLDRLSESYRSLEFSY